MKKIISMLLVVAMITAVFAVSIAATGAAETATITIYDLNGNAVTENYSVGEEFTVYTTLDVSASVSNGMIGSVQGTQTYSSSVLQLVDELDSEYGDFVDQYQVFPILGSAAIANAGTAGRITFNASTPSTTNAFKFNSADSKLIVTTYKVTSAGSGEVKNTIKNLAAADNDLTRIVFEGKQQTGKSYSMASSFTDPVSIDHAEITVHSLDGTTETINANIGDEVTVYTTLNVSAAVSNGMIASLNATQKYTSSVLELTDSVDEEGLIEDVDKVFPILGDKAMANAGTKGTITYAASTPSLTKAFLFNDDTCQLITTTYKVKTNGYANVTNSLIILASAEDKLNPIVSGGVIKDGVELSMIATFDDPSGEPATATTVTIIGPDGKADVKEFKVGEKFTVYTILDVSSSVSNGMVATVEGSQTFTSSKLQITDKYDGEYGEIEDIEALLPVIGDRGIATVQGNTVYFSASKPEVNNGFLFNSTKSKLIVTNYKATAVGKATINTELKNLAASDKASTKIVYGGQLQSGMSYTMYSQYTDPGNSETPTKPSESTDTATITIYGLDGKSATKTFKVGESFTVYSTFNASKATSNGLIGSIMGAQNFTSSIVKATDAVDEYGVVADSASMFPIIKDNAIGRIVDGAIRYNSSTPYIGAKGYQFNSDDALLMVSHYTVIAAGNGEIRDTLTTVAAADADLTRIVSKGVVASGVTIGGVASFTEPGKTEETYLLGDANGDGEVDLVDATIVKRYATLVKVPFSDDLIKQGDVDGDGEVTAVDATYIQRFCTLVKVPYAIGEKVTK